MCILMRNTEYKPFVSKDLKYVGMLLNMTVTDCVSAKMKQAHKTLTYKHMCNLQICKCKSTPYLWWENAIPSKTMQQNECFHIC